MLPILLATALLVGPGVGFEVNGKHLDYDPWAIFFYDQRSIDTTRHYMTLMEPELEARSGVDVKVTSTLKRTTDGCPGMTSTGYHIIVVQYDPAEDRSHTFSCSVGGARQSARVVFSGITWVNGRRSGSSKIYRRNLVGHEMGHAFGLAHPAIPCDQSGTDPLMCGEKWGGYGTLDKAHKFTPYDIAGFKALVANRP